MEGANSNPVFVAFLKATNIKKPAPAKRRPVIIPWKERIPTVFEGARVGLYRACAVVRENASRRIIDIAALPGTVGHPEVFDHMRLAGVFGLK